MDTRCVRSDVGSVTPLVAWEGVGMDAAGPWRLPEHVKAVLSNSPPPEELNARRARHPHDGGAPVHPIYTPLRADPVEDVHHPAQAVVIGL